MCIKLYNQQCICKVCVDDFNRVVLSALPDVKHSDYINASYADVSMSGMGI